MTTPSLVLGVDVGFSKDRRTTPLCLMQLDAVQSRIDLVEGPRRTTRASASAEIEALMSRHGRIPWV